MADAVAATAALDTAGVQESDIIARRHPFGQRIKYALMAFVWRQLLLKPMYFLSSIKSLFAARNKNDPDMVKRYPARKSLPVRIFFPPSYTPSPESTTTKVTKLPTLLTIHGGGFVLGRPHDNDGWNRDFSTRHGFLVVGLDYSKAPSHPFPTATHDLEAVITSVLSDSSLPVDAGRVAVAGFSAGGNLALSVCQLPSLQGRLAAAIPVYPVVDFVTPQETKARARRYKPSLGGFRARERDFLLAMSPMFNWSYVNPGTRRDDPLLSPQFAERGKLPRSIFMIACEMDLLGPEAWRMACKLAGKKVPGVDQVIGKEETARKGELITEGDERFAWEEETEDGSRYKWLLVPDTIHGFDQDNIERLVKDPVTMEDARIKRDKVIGMIGAWLLEKAFKKGS